MKKMIIAAMAAIFSLVSCNDDNFDHPNELVYSWDFESTSSDWAGDFADYMVGEEELCNFQFEHDTLPLPLNQSKKAMTLSGTNPGDELFMFMKKKVNGLEPNTLYYVTFTIQFASNIPENMVLDGGSPGDSVFIKAGATQIEPLKITDENNYFRVNIDKGEKNMDGENMIMVGDFSNDTASEDYVLKTIKNDIPFSVMADANGRAWIIVGTESWFEGTTKICFNSIEARFY